MSKKPPKKQLLLIIDQYLQRPDVSTPRHWYLQNIKIAKKDIPSCRRTLSQLPLEQRHT
jgi:hypothetical protein